METIRIFISEICSYIDHFQTLISGILAVFAAIVTGVVVWISAKLPIKE